MHSLEEAKEESRRRVARVASYRGKLSEHDGARLWRAFFWVQSQHAGSALSEQLPVPPLATQEEGKTDHLVAAAAAAAQTVISADNSPTLTVR